jgi:hypothetical protein
MLAVNVELKADEARHCALDDGIVESMIKRDLIAVTKETALE